ncbi:MAG TPA: hypothetical protein VII19_03140 [Acidimicrobiales bacterium]
MVALAIVLSVVVLLLAVLVAGLLRSHADILKALHDLGAGVGEPAGSHDHDHGSSPVSGSPGAVGVPLTMGPPLPGERSSTSAPTIAGVTPSGDALAVSPTGSDRLTLLAFLSSGCASCVGFWKDLHRPDELGLPPHTRLVVITKGPEMEIPGEVGAQAPPGIPVVMSTEAWGDYEVPGSPFFVLVDGSSGRRIGEGVANRFGQVAELVRRAQVDAGGFAGGSRSHPHGEGIDGPERELANDRELAAAGILPGDPSLYPSSLTDVYPPEGSGARAARRPIGKAS